MEPTTISIITASAVSLLVSYLKKATEEFVGEVGKGLGKAVTTFAGSRVQEVYDAIKARFASKEPAKKALDNLVKAPEDLNYQAAVRIELTKLLQEDAIFARQLTDLLKEAAQANVDEVFNTQIYGDVQKLAQMGNVYGDVTL